MKAHRLSIKDIFFRRSLMGDTVLFYTNPMSRGRVVHWMLEEVGAAYDLKVLDFKKGEHKAPAYLAVNPMGKVPAIVHRGTVVTETPAICAYLADAFSEARLAPELRDPARGAYYRWLFFGVACLEAATMDRGYSRAPAPRGANGYGTYEDTLNTLEQGLLRSSFLTGDRFTAADLYMASAIGYGFMTKGLERRPVFESYHARCIDRPGFRRFQEKAAKLTPQPA
jgi:glutathione S-transferase